MHTDPVPCSFICPPSTTTPRPCRYIILPPSECRSLELYPRVHPSARHSSVDWANLTQVVHDEHDEHELIDLQSCNAMDRYQLALCSLSLCMRTYINACMSCHIYAGENVPQPVRSQGHRGGACYGRGALSTRWMMPSTAVYPLTYCSTAVCPLAYCSTVLQKLVCV